jgi:indolepyruvate ferredoxin oxidoreductase
MSDIERSSRRDSQLLPDASLGHLAAEAVEIDLAPEDVADSASRVYLSGIQTIAQLPILQRLRDAAAGLNTAGFVSGYRGSPLGGIDQALWKIRPRLEEHHVRFQPGINEDLAATMIWGTQQVNLSGDARYDGVFSMWYGKAPGVDRSMDVFKHANGAGSARHGGVLLIAGDDHAAKSSTFPNQSEQMFAAAMIPVLNPAGVQDYLDYGLHGWAMSRYSGCWVALKATADTVESSASVYVDPTRLQIQVPTDFQIPATGLNIRWPDPPLEQELRLQRYKVYAALAYARANQLNKVVIDSPNARLGIITTGKSYLDVRQALDALGIDAATAARVGIRVFKIGMNWPLDAEGVRNFAQGLEEILVVEEKRQLIEYQLKEQLYNWREDVRPRVIGKYDEKGEWELPMAEWQLPAASDLSPAIIARVIATRVARFHSSTRISERVAFLEAKEKALAKPRETIARVPHYCSGCPHNTSTMNVPEGSKVLAGIGCHYMATWLAPTTTQTFSHMGGEGVAWAGQAPFSKRQHVFANLGDGTYHHSGLLAIRQAVAAKARITYKILFNDAVAMTGGQPLESGLSVATIAQQVAAEQVGKVVVVTEDLDRYKGVNALPSAFPVYHRRELDRIQRELRDYEGVSALIYDQTCAAEKRRRRKKGEYSDPPIRAFINERVCEGCGDCSAKSNCMSVVPVDTEFGRKRLIDQSSCNKDFSCVEGFCPSFVTVHGGKLRKGRAQNAPADAFSDLPEPMSPSLERPYGILVTGVGGTGVVTIGVLLGLAANLENKGISVLDMAGLAQKGGPVWSHIRIGTSPEVLHATRLDAGEANAVIGCDIVVAVADDSLAKMQAGVTRAVINSDFSVTSDFVRTFGAQAKSGDIERYRDPKSPLAAMEEQIAEAVGSGNADFLAATRLATALLGDSIATNPFMLGYAHQKGLLPLAGDSLMKAIELHGVAVEANKKAFLWGRRAAHDLRAVEKLSTEASGAVQSGHVVSQTLEDIVARRSKDLLAYQDAAYAKRYTDLVERVRSAEQRIAAGNSDLAVAVARCYYKLLAYKDEYEVARLYTDPAYLQSLNETFEGDFTLTFHFAPPLVSKSGSQGSEPRKRTYGPWMLSALRLLAKCKRFRGTALDVFGRSEDRRLERRLIADYEAVVTEILGNLDPLNYDAAVELAALPFAIRGFGPVKQRHVDQVKKREVELVAKFRNRKEPPAPPLNGVPQPVVIMAG